MKILQVLFLAAFVGAAFAQPGNDARQQAIETVRSSLPSGSRMVLVADEDTGLAEATVAIQRQWQSATVARFFRVVPAQYEIRDGKVVAEQVHLDSSPEWIVAILPGKQPLGLFGMEERILKSNFALLRTFLDVTVESEAEALSLFDYWLQVCKGEKERQSVVVDALSAISRVASNYREIEGPRGHTTFQSWLVGHRKLLLSITRPRARISKGNVDVDYWFAVGNKIEARAIRFPAMGGE